MALEWPSQALHLFCDESGGCSPSETLFLVTAVTIDATHAGTVLRRFRKETKVSGEVHGHELNPDQRTAFFKHLQKHAGDGFSATVVCERTDRLGGWAMGKIKEHRLRSLMVVEAAGAVLRKAKLPVARLGITKDGGRYTKALLEEARLMTVDGLQRLRPALEVDVQYGQSHQSPALQIADVVANALHRCRHGDPACRSIEERFVGEGRMAVMGAALLDHRPAWLFEQPVS